MDRPDHHEAHRRSLHGEEQISPLYRDASAPAGGEGLGEVLGQGIGGDLGLAHHALSPPSRSVTRIAARRAAARH